MQKGKLNSGNTYDNIFRENLEVIFIPFVKRQLGLDIIEMEALPDKLISTRKEVDGLYKVSTKEEGIFILHLEVQTRNDPKMIYRVGEYHALLLTKYNLPIKHIVLYLGDSLATVHFYELSTANLKMNAKKVLGSRF